MRVLICGAGIAGLTLAWHLERAGWEVELVERAPAFREGGYMIDFYGAGYEIARRMGIDGRLREVGYQINELRYVDRHGRRTSGARVPSGFDRLVSLLRVDLARAIADGVHAKIWYGTGVAAVDRHEDGVEVRLTDGTHREVDLLVGADGAHSVVRGLAFGSEERFERYLGHHVAAYVIADERLSEQIGMRYQMLTVPGSMAGAYALRGGRLALLFLRREPDPALPADPAAALRDHFGPLGWILPEVLDRVPADLYYDQVTQIEIERWSRGRVVLVGDACQAVSLFAGHGASLGMAAAWVLADELTGEPVDGRAADLAAALDRYQRRMRPVIAETQAFGRRFIEWLAPSSGLRIVMRDWLLRLAALPGADRLFLRSLTPGGHRLITGGRA
ncbi:FAD-dependent oxidoreductase [Thermoactinospora rubra]|uniref:FAD-dependent oxidoreductase n=1 Tax=Thermoactinospora rubra TaxID=1088767 RepID=UPI001302037F|nr:FAD-dependent oxidoreductase [Thermoactinospora rubra]